MVSQSADAASGQSSGLQDYISWQYPYRNARIYFHRDVVRGLSDQALHRLRDDVEIGGILWGKPGPTDSIIILDATPVPSTGPRFNTSAVDMRNLVQKIDVPPEPSLSAVGYFRTHIRDGLFLSKEDRALIGQHLREPESVFLIIKPFAAGACTAGFFFWRGGSLANNSDLEVPFIAASETGHGTPPVAAADPKQEHKKEDESIVNMLRQSAMRQGVPQRTGASASPSPGEPAAHPLRRQLIVAALLAMLVSVTGTGVYVAWPALHSLFEGAPPDNPPATEIDLQAAPGPDNQLMVSWNQNAHEVANAEGGTLFIKDGRRSTNLPLDNAQLRSGKLLYSPASRNVEFRLQLNMDSQRTVQESVRVGTARAKTRANQVPIGRSYVVVRVPTTPSATDAEPGTVSATGADKTSSPVPGTPLPGLARTSPGSAAPAPSPEVNGRYVLPQVVQEMMPKTAPLGHFVQISVKVAIDRTGRVTDARVVENTGEDSEALDGVATEAAREWRFHPATLGGKPVPSEYTVVFAFRPQLP